MGSSDDTIPVTCSECNAAFRVRTTVAGKRIRCPNCGGVISVPSAQDAGESGPIANDNIPSRQTRRQRFNRSSPRTQPHEELVPPHPQRQKKAGASFNYWYLCLVPVATIVIIGVVHFSRLVMNLSPKRIDPVTTPIAEAKTDEVLSGDLGFPVVNYQLNGFNVRLPAAYAVVKEPGPNRKIWKIEHSDRNESGVLASVKDHWDPIEDASTRGHVENIKLVALQNYGYNFVVEQGTVNNQTWIITTFQLPHKTRGTYQGLDLYISRNGEHLHIMAKMSFSVESDEYKQLMACLKNMALQSSN